MSSPASLRVLLDLLAAQSTSSSWVFIDALDGLSWNTIALRKVGDDAVSPLLHAGKSVLAWNRSTAGARGVQATALRKISAILDKLATPATRSARAELDDLLQRQRMKELPGLVKIVLESRAFEEAESAIAEIAELGTPQALAALSKIRQQPVRTLDHQFETGNPEVESGYSPKWVSVPRPSSDLGETLKGEARIRWERA